MLTPNYLFKGGEILPQRNIPFKSFLENLRKKLLLGKKSDQISWPSNGVSHGGQVVDSR